ncbi:MAG: ferritin-like protein [Streptosporangiaceae bacterium]
MDRDVVVQSRSQLWFLLAEAAQLEHMIMCQYLFAGFSIRDAWEFTGDQADAVKRWRAELADIAVQEMLHLALVANLMSATGAAPTFTRPNFPHTSGYFPGCFQFRLLPFGEQAVTHFLYQERPEGLDLADADVCAHPAVPVPEPVSEIEEFPRPQEFNTIGQLYRGIELGLDRLTGVLGESELFCGSPRAQITPELLNWPQVIPVTGLASARQAVDEIIEQGEGARGDWREAHYGRFLRMHDELIALRSADPGFQPARPVLAVYERQPYDVRQPQPIVTDPRARETAELCNLGYAALEHLLTRFFTHTNETDEQLAVLATTAFSLMSDVIDPIGRALTSIPAGPGYPGQTAGPAFEMYYPMRPGSPWRHAAWTVLRERIAHLRDRCQQNRPGLDAIATAGERLAETTSKLAAHS